MPTAQALIGQGDVRVDWKLEFRTWSGSAWAWTDYSSYLVNFSGIGAQIEQSAIPHAFRMTLGTITVDNSTGFWTDVGTLDGKLVNASQSYGKKFYKRLVRISEVRYDKSGTGTTTVIGTGAVRDVRLKSDGLQAIIKVISLDAIAADQRADGDKVQQHTIGSSNKSAESSWTTSDPASDTAEVALYRFRDEEPEDDQVYLGFFKNRRVVDVVERTAWAMDDLATDITENIVYTDKTASTNERVTVRDIPPDDDTISDGLTPDRTRAIIWNPERNVLVCCIGHLIYDLDVETNTYTLRNTLTAGRDVARAWYTTEADDAGKNTRIILLQYDVETYGTNAIRTTTAWCTVLDATGTGAYTLLANEVALSTDFYPCTHVLREGWYDTVGANGMRIGQYNASEKYGEDVVVPFQQKLQAVIPNPDHYDTGTTSLFGLANAGGGDPTFPAELGRGYFTLFVDVGADTPAGMKSALGAQPAASITLDPTVSSGGRLYYATWLGTYSLRYLDLGDYTTAANLALDTGTNDQPPLVIYSPMFDAGQDDRIYVAQMEWKDGPHPMTSYSVCHFRYYDISAATWTELTFLSGATGSDQAWTIIDIMQHQSFSTGLCAILFNRETMKYRFCSNVSQNTWAAVDGVCQTFYTSGKKDNENLLRGLYERRGPTTDTINFVEAGPNRLWSWDNVDLTQENQNFPINTDFSIYPSMTDTGANFPDTDTPAGMMFGISANDNPNVGLASPPSGEYVLWQYANRLSGFLKLLDVTDLSIWQLRTELAVAYGYVTYYAPDGTLVFKPRSRTGSATVTFSAANRNYYGAEIVSQAWESVVNDVLIKPYDVKSETRTSPIEKGASDSDGMLTGVTITGDSGENSQWRLVFTSATAWDLYKLAGSNASSSVAKATGDINTIERGITDGAYLNIMPQAFEGTFETGDNFTWWAFEPQETLEQLEFRDWAHDTDTTSIDDWQRTRSSGEIDNRFITKLYAPWIAKEVLNWRKDPHLRIRIEAVYDGTLLPLDIIAINDSDLGFDGTETFQIMGIRHASDRMRTTIEAVKL